MVRCQHAPSRRPPAALPPFCPATRAAQPSRDSSPVAHVQGGIFSSDKKDVRLLIAGLDSAGKTSARPRTQPPALPAHRRARLAPSASPLRALAAILYKLKRGEKRKAEHVNTIPTMHFNVEHCLYKNKTFSVWDIGGQDAIRPLWRHHYTGTQGLIYVVDSNDRARVQKSAEELHKMILDHAMAHACLLVYANKSDLPHALSAEEVRDELKLEQLREHAWHVQPSCGTSGEGLWLGLKWLAENVKSL